MKKETFEKALVLQRQLKHYQDTKDDLSEVVGVLYKITITSGNGYVMLPEDLKKFVVDTLYKFLEKNIIQTQEQFNKLK